MFWAAFVWGLGVTVGGSFGLMLFVAMWAAWSAVMRTEAAKRANELAELSRAALVRRNELTEKQIEQIREVVTSLDDISEELHRAHMSQLPRNNPQPARKE